MQSLIHADVFFFIASIGFIVLGLAILVALIYLIKILLDFYFIVRIFKEEGRYIAADLEELRLKIKEEGFKAKPILTFFRKLLVTIFIGRSEKKTHKKEGSSKHKNESSKSGE